MRQKKLGILILLVFAISGMAAWSIFVGKKDLPDQSTDKTKIAGPQQNNEEYVLREINGYKLKENERLTSEGVIYNVDPQQKDTSNASPNAKLGDFLTNWSETEEKPQDKSKSVKVIDGMIVDTKLIKPIPTRAPNQTDQANAQIIDPEIKKYFAKERIDTIIQNAIETQAIKKGEPSPQLEKPEIILNIPINK